MSAPKAEADTKKDQQPEAQPARSSPDGRKLVQLVDSLNRVLVTQGDKLDWQNASKAGALGMWVVEGAGRNRVIVRNFRDPHMCLDAGGTSVRPVNTLVQPEPLPLQIVRVSSARGPATMAFAPGHSQTPLPLHVIGTPTAGGFSLNVLATQSLPEPVGNVENGESVGAWLIIFALITIIALALAWAMGWIDLPSSSSAPVEQAVAAPSEQAILDVWSAPGLCFDTPM